MARRTPDGKYVAGEALRRSRLGTEQGPRNGLQGVRLAEKPVLCGDCRILRAALDKSVADLRHIKSMLGPLITADRKRKRKRARTAYHKQQSIACVQGTATEESEPVIAPDVDGR